MSQRSKVLLILAVVILIFVVVGAGVAHNDLNYTSTAALLVGAVVALATGRKSPGDDDE